MKINSIIYRYILKELSSPFLVNLGFLTSVFLMAQILEVTNMVVNYKVSIVAVMKMFLYSTPFYLEYTIPMSVMLTVLLTFMKMSADKEIIALKAGGVSVFRLLPPVLLFCLLGAVMTAWITIYGIPWGKTSYKQLAIEVAMSNVDVGLKERTFNDSFDGVMLYVNSIDVKTKELKDVFIEDQRNEKMVSSIVAPKGRLISGGDSMAFTLRLFDGSVNQVRLDNKTANSLRFRKYDINMNLKSEDISGKSKTKHRDEMSIAEHREFFRTADKTTGNYRKTLMKYYEKFSIPFACFALGLVAFPIGIGSMSRDKAGGLQSGMVYFMLYFMLLTFGWSSGKSGSLHPAIGMWIPNILIGGIGLYLISRVAEEREVQISVITGPIILFIKRKIFRKK